MKAKEWLEKNGYSPDMIYTFENICDIMDQFNYQENNRYPQYFEPNEDSNQLDWLENKLIKKVGIVSILLESYPTGRWHCTIRRFVDEEGWLNVVGGIGKSKNKARLNAILEFVQTQGQL